MHKKILSHGRTRLAALVLGLFVLGSVMFFAFGGTETEQTLAVAPVAGELDSRPITDDDLKPEAASPAPEAEVAEDQDAETVAELNVMRGIIGRGDTVGAILQAWLPPQEISDLDKAAQKVFSLRRIKQGQAYSVHSDSDKNFICFEYEIDNDSRLLVSRDESGFKAEKLDIEYEIQLHRVESEIKSSMFQAMADAGESAALAVQLSNVFAWEINFIRDIRAGDRFSLLVEKRYRDGEFRDYGKLLAASFVNREDKYEAFLFRDDDGNSQYFTREGQSLRRAFLKAPLSSTRISSGYTNRRLHPVTMDWKAHPAIDYAAPTGTPIKSVGKGTVNFVGYNQAAGNYIKVQHLNNYETMYLHLSAFSKGLKKGSKVAQGQVIGFVGKTGYATGPHLDFRMKKSGAYINPLTALSPRETPVSKKEMESFMAQVNIFMAFLEDRRNLAEYDRSMVNLF